MNKVAEILTQMLLKNQEIEESEYSVYKYGVTIFLEKTIYFLICLCIVVIFKAPIEGILFFITFTPLRVYAGGLHLEHFCSCLILSCLTFLFVIWSAQIVDIPIGISDLVTCLALALIRFLYPVENRNREVDDEENAVFKRRLNYSILFEIALVILLSFLRSKKAVGVISMTSILVTVTMICGKIKYSIWGKQ